MSLELVMPKEGTAFKVGENVHLTVSTSGFTGVKVIAKDVATGREEELKASVAKSGGKPPGTEDGVAVWSTAGRNPEHTSSP